MASLLLVFACGCATARIDDSQVRVYRAPLAGAASQRAVPPGCRLLSASRPVNFTELEMEGQKNPYRVQRTRAATAGANVLLVRSTMIQSRRDFECPGASPITDCPPSSGATFRVVFETYSCSADALGTLPQFRWP